MTQPIHPCFWFDGNAKAAAEFYCTVFKNGHAKITVDSPMVVQFEIFGKQIMGLNGGPMYKINPSISLFILCESEEYTRHIWNRLIEGGKALIPLDKQEWSPLYGWLQDKFGITWQIAINDRETGKNLLTPSLLFTQQNFGKAEEAIHFYTRVFENSGVDVIMHYPKGDNSEGKVLFSEFKLDGYNLIAMDGPGTHEFTFDEGVSFVVHCKDQKEIDYFWDTFTGDGGTESMCGWCKDKFGISWQIVPATIGKLMMDPEKGGRVAKELMKMKKIDLQTLENA